jgi:hypothetical protein
MRVGWCAHTPIRIWIDFTLWVALVVFSIMSVGSAQTFEHTEKHNANCSSGLMCKCDVMPDSYDQD